MKGFMRRAAVLLGGAVALAGTVGCYGYRDLVDPCYPERYEYAARKELHEAFAPQVLNGHVLDQTVWNYHFEPGTDRLTPGGLEHLAYLARRRPAPDCMIYLQTAQDLGYDAAAPERLVAARTELDGKRKVAIEKFLTAQTAGHGVAFQVEVHDPADPGLSSIPVNSAIQQRNLRFRGGLLTGGGVGASATGGGVTGGGITGGGQLAR
jgi:hypothetical protein